MSEIVIPKKSENTGPDVKWLRSGTHNVTIIDVIQTLDFNKNPKINKNGDAGIDIVLADSEGKDYKETFWIGEKNQWILDKFCEKAGIDNSAGDLPKSAVLGKRVWLTLGNSYPKTPNGDFVMSDDGKWRKSYLFTVGIDKFDPNVKPTYEGKQIDDKDGPTNGKFYKEYTKMGATASPVVQAATSPPIETKGTEEVEGW